MVFNIKLLTKATGSSFVWMAKMKGHVLMLFGLFYNLQYVIHDFTQI